MPLSFVRLEPYVVPKTSLRGINVERVDTRVVQVIYTVDPNNRLVKARKILVGQLVDVFIDRCPNNGSLMQWSFAKGVPKRRLAGVIRSRHKDSAGPFAYDSIYAPIVAATVTLFVWWLVCLWMYRQKLFVHI